MVIIERATDLWNPTLGTVSIKKFKIRLEPFMEFQKFEFYS